MFSPAIEILYDDLIARLEAPGSLERPRLHLQLWHRTMVMKKSATGAR